jgi:hypothetical protein
MPFPSDPYARPLESAEQMRHRAEREDVARRLRAVERSRSAASLARRDAEVAFDREAECRRRASLLSSWDARRAELLAEAGRHREDGERLRAEAQDDAHRARLGSLTAAGEVRQMLAQCDAAVARRTSVARTGRPATPAGIRTTTPTSAGTSLAAARAKLRRGGINDREFSDAQLRGMLAEAARRSSTPAAPARQTMTVADARTRLRRGGVDDRSFDDDDVRALITEAAHEMRDVVAEAKVQQRQREETARRHAILGERSPVVTRAG